jgi:hypothetical protein
MLFKHNLDLEKMKMKECPETIDAENMSASHEWNQEQIIKMLSEHM